MLSCTDYQERAALALDGIELPMSEATDLQTHLAECRACDLDHSLDRATRAVLRHRFPVLEAPQSVRHSIENFLRQQIAL